MHAVLGQPLHEATVTDSTILGGATMRAYVADWSLLGSGERPWTQRAGRRSSTRSTSPTSRASATHGYELLGARDGEEVAHEGVAPDGATVVDGGRTRRTRERFAARLPAGAAVHGIVRLDGRAGTRVEVLAGETPVAAFELGDDDDWVEKRVRDPRGPRRRADPHRAPRRRRLDHHVPLLVLRRRPLTSPLLPVPLHSGLKTIG